DIDYLVSEILVKGARAVRAVYEEEPAMPVIVSTSGCSPCEACPELEGLEGSGAVAANDFYNRLIANRQLMGLVDALNMNVSDHYDGYGNMDGTHIPSVWGNYDLVRRKLDAANYRGKKILASESWISWDGGENAIDVNGDGLKNEQDAYAKTLTIIGQCMQRGLNTINLPWSDNSSGWAMGLTKRRDYNGRIKRLDPKIVIPASDGGADVVTKKVVLKGTDDDFEIEDGSGNVFNIQEYINPPDPNHLHYYIWKWYAQIAAGPDEVIRHALAGEIGNDIAAMGPGFTGIERYRISAYNRTRDSFLVLLYSSGANGTSWAWVSIPSQIQHGRQYNNEFSQRDFRGEGFAEGEKFWARIVTKDISQENGSDVGRIETVKKNLTVKDGILRVPILNMRKFTTVEFLRAPPAAAGKADK
nr:hypothetical protein [Planctomycetales bacterium]NIM10079.1 hypothetical protein [Planctomycetales bacterium]NIN09522.1 hypothetical protein [Planctomycetales bacterium]NIN78632.1 hypothetical protein [Planctomycetales bacterium]NIO35826.1 hypothetical protein [Planctomycetales bacterium]